VTPSDDRVGCFDHHRVLASHKRPKFRVGHRIDTLKSLGDTGTRINQLQRPRRRLTAHRVNLTGPVDRSRLHRNAAAKLKPVPWVTSALLPSVESSSDLSIGGVLLCQAEQASARFKNAPSHLVLSGSQDWREPRARLLGGAVARALAGRRRRG